MFNKYMYSYFVLNVELEQGQLELGTQESANAYLARQEVEDGIEQKYPSSEGWELKILILNDEPIEYVGNMV